MYIDPLETEISKNHLSILKWPLNKCWGWKVWTLSFQMPCRTHFFESWMQRCIISNEKVSDLYLGVLLENRWVSFLHSTSHYSLTLFQPNGLELSEVDKIFLSLFPVLIGVWIRLLSYLKVSPLSVKCFWKSFRALSDESTCLASQGNMFSRCKAEVKIFFFWSLSNQMDVHFLR